MGQSSSYECNKCGTENAEENVKKLDETRNNYNDVGKEFEKASTFFADNVIGNIFGSTVGNIAGAAIKIDNTANMHEGNKYYSTAREEMAGGKCTGCSYQTAYNFTYRE
jgi:hypothetical protein